MVQITFKLSVKKVLVMEELRGMNEDCPIVYHHLLTMIHFRGPDCADQKMSIYVVNQSDLISNEMWFLRQSIIFIRHYKKKKWIQKHA